MAGVEDRSEGDAALTVGKSDFVELFFSSCPSIAIVTSVFWYKYAILVFPTL